MAARTDGREALAGWQLERSSAEAYERYGVPAWSRALAQGLLRIAAPGPGERLLDVACGTGIVARPGHGDHRRGGLRLRRRRQRGHAGRRAGRRVGAAAAHRLAPGRRRGPAGRRRERRRRHVPAGAAVPARPRGRAAGDAARPRARRSRRRRGPPIDPAQPRLGGAGGAAGAVHRQRRDARAVPRPRCRRAARARHQRRLPRACGCRSSWPARTTRRRST